MFGYLKRSPKQTAKPTYDMKKLKSPNYNHYIFFCAVIFDVFFLYNLIQYIRFGLDTHLYGFLISLSASIIIVIYLWKNDYFPKHDKTE